MRPALSTPTVSQRFRQASPAQRRAWREEAGLTRRQVATFLDCSETTVKNWEIAGRHTPQAGWALGMCWLLAEHGVEV